MDELIKSAAELLVQTQQCSTSLIQRNLEIGYHRAGRIMNALELAKIVSQQDGFKPRIVLIKQKEQITTLLDEHKSEIENYFNTDYTIEFSKTQENMLQAERDKIANELLEKERKRKLKEEIKQDLINKVLLPNNK
ncbi:hypothetical protein AGMMS4956_18300 [Bacteroidia bacterium]|nr:hypothetical protein AGMMS4956_18300 [Bacteroidia bacterium]